jgi:hypothetical protein
MHDMLLLSEREGSSQESLLLRSRCFVVEMELQE